MHSCVEQRGDRHRHCVGAERTQHRAPGNEEEEVAESRDHADAGEAQQLVRCDIARSDPARPLGPAKEQPPDATQVIDGRRDDVDPRVGVVDPVDGNFSDAQTQALRGDEHLGVEEPLFVLDERQQLLRRLESQSL